MWRRRSFDGAGVRDIKAGAVVFLCGRNAAVAKWNLERAKGADTVNPHPEYFRGITKIETPDDYTTFYDMMIEENS